MLQYTRLETGKRDAAPQRMRGRALPLFRRKRSGESGESGESDDEASEGVDGHDDDLFPHCGEPRMLISAFCPCASDSGLS
ncbi:MAG: hypothetical protein WC483_04220 [Candidatus Paceibacterota bacterium]